MCPMRMMRKRLYTVKTYRPSLPRDRPGPRRAAPVPARGPARRLAAGRQREGRGGIRRAVSCYRGYRPEGSRLPPPGRPRPRDHRRSVAIRRDRGPARQTAGARPARGGRFPARPGPASDGMAPGSARPAPIESRAAGCPPDRRRRPGESWSRPEAPGDRDGRDISPTLADRLAPIWRPRTTTLEPVPSLEPLTGRPGC
jgi:hypothetical protein